MTKEQLIKQVAVLEEENNRFKDNEDKIRRDVSKVLGNYIYSTDRFSHKEEKELIVFSWVEIFAELGKLLAKQKRLQYVEDIEQYRLEAKGTRVELENIKRILEDEQM